MHVLHNVHFDMAIVFRIRYDNNHIILLWKNLNTLG
jgi:hypothetical protein